jgi:hypothetical protein
MNERVKALLHTALRLSPEEREELAQTLLANLNTDFATVEHLFGDGDASPDGEPHQPPSDILAKYLDN